MEIVHAIGLIKHVSKLKKIPSGKIRVLSPMEMRGLECDFLLQDVKIPQEEQRLLESGMSLKFIIKGGTSEGYFAKELKPVERAEYNGSVIRVPSPTEPTSRTVVSLDLTLNPVVVSSESLRKFKEPLAKGDYVRLVIRWTEWIKAQHNRRKPEFDALEVLERSRTRARSLSQGREEKSVVPKNRVTRGNAEVSSEDLSPQHERLARQRELNQRALRRRSRSVGFAPPVGDGTAHPHYHHYMPQLRFPYPYPMMAPEMMYGSFMNFHNPSMCMPNYMPPFRGAP